MSSLTKKQAEVLAFIGDYIKEQGYAPSYREIAEHFDLSSTATVHQHVKSLLEKNVISMGEDGESRSIELVEMPSPMSKMSPFSRGTTGGYRRQEIATDQSFQPAPSFFLPLAGLITAGEPIEAIQNNETIAVPANFVIDGANSYVLKVKGQSMIEDGILDGDYVVIERNPSPNNGDVVVALLDNAYATLKKFYREKNRIRLQPANHTMDPIYVKDCNVQGVVRAVIRNFTPA